MVGAVRALLRAVSNLLRLLIAPLWLAVRALSRPKGPWVELRLAPRLTELPVPLPIWQRWIPRTEPLRRTALSEVRDLCRRMAKDPSVHGLVVHVPSLEAGWAACASLRDALLTLRAAGKQVVTYMPQGGGARELFVATAGQRVAMSPAGSIAPLGLASGSLYAKRLLDRLGVEVQVQATGEYKSAAEPLSRDAMSEPVRRQLEELLAAMQQALEAALTQRGLDADAVRAAFARGLMTAQAARDAGLLDALLYEDELAAWLGAGAERAPATAAARYLQRSRAALFRPVRAQPYVAVVPVRGAIVAQGLPLGRASAVLSTLVTSLREIAVDPNARAVVLYVNSPGGSALASDLIHREVERLALRKPVVAYFGDVAASGGYYVAAPCARIFAQPVSITGSIGVISVKAAVPGVIERIGLHPQLVRTAAHADMFSPLRRFDAEEEQQVAEHTRVLYARFLDVVAAGRRRPVSEIEPHARGRVWSGRDALRHGLIDELGGFERAVEHARTLVVDLPAALRERLEPRVHVTRARSEPAPPPRPGATWLAALVPDELDPALVTFAARGEHALFYAVGVAALR
jgi:protease IV